MSQEFDCIDIGVNLTNRQFRGDVEQVIEEAKQTNVSRIIVTGSCESSSLAADRLCEQHPGYLYSTAGIHPHDAKQYDQKTSTPTLQSLYPKPHVVAVGECGLDYNRDFSPRDQQRICFAAQLELAVETGLPLFLHERDAHDDFVSMLNEVRSTISKGVVHCFTGSAKEAETYLELDLYLGITGWICDERRGVHLREIVKSVPVERLMVETDAPYLAPRDYRPKIKRNEPKYLPHILNTVADCRGEDVNELAVQINNTTKSFFEIP